MESKCIAVGRVHEYQDYMSRDNNIWTPLQQLEFIGEPPGELILILTSAAGII